MIPPKLIINAALTGAVPTRADTAHVPLTPEEIVADALACAAAGASVLHLHARDAMGQPTWEPDVYRRILAPIRQARPELILCVSTSGRREQDVERRAAVLDLDGDAKPDLASLSAGSMNFVNEVSVNQPATIQELARRMSDRGIKPELEFFEPGMIHYAKYLTRKGYLKSPWYANVLLGSLGTSPADMRNLSHMVDMLPPDTIWFGAGIGRFQLQVNAAAIVMGGHVRVGLEDNLHYDVGRTQLETNARLIERLVQIAALMERDVASPAEARQIIGLDPR